MVDLAPVFLLLAGLQRTGPSGGTEASEPPTKGGLLGPWNAFRDLHGRNGHAGRGGGRSRRVRARSGFICPVPETRRYESFESGEAVQCRRKRRGGESGIVTLRRG